jgi:hypothetical protein
MIDRLLILCLILLLGYLIFNIINCSNKENFTTTKLPELNSGSIVSLYDDKGTKLNVALIAQPFGYDSDYKTYLENINKYIYMGITSYMEFPYVPSNPLDNYVAENEIDKNPKGSSYNYEMYYKICEGWLHCFRNPKEYLPSDKILSLVSESDFVNYNVLRPDDTKKEYDFVYSCPKVDKNSHCDDWVSFNKNWALALKCLPILCLKHKLKGLLIGRQGCKLPDGCDKYIETTGWVDYFENIKLYRKCKFLFLPNVRDASPRVLTECLATGLPCLVNYNILGGWKYVDEEKTGTFFNDENDIDSSVTRLLANMSKYNPRQYIIDNYGPINAGKALKKLLFDNFKDRLNVNEDKVEYITLRGQLTGFTPELTTEEKNTKTN